MNSLLVAVLMVVGLTALFWWLPGKGDWIRLFVALLLIQLIIWWCANDLDNSYPWDLDRPLLTAESDPIWFRVLLLLLLYGPITLAAWSLWKARRQ